MKITAKDLTIEQLASKLVVVVKQRTDTDTVVCTIIGGGGSGKSTLSRLLNDSEVGVVSISVDDYVIGDRNFRREKLESGDPREKYDFQKMNDFINQIRSCTQALSIPSYDEQTGLALDAPKELYRKISCPVSLLFIEGVFAGFVENPDLVIFLDTPERIRLENRINRARSIRKEGDIEQVKQNFEEREEKEFKPFALPYKGKADYIVEVEKNNGEYLYTLTQTN